MDVRKIGEPDDMGTWELRDEEWRVGANDLPLDVDDPGDPWCRIRSAWTKTDPPVYVGDEEMARHIIDNLGIVPEYRTAGSNVATIGYCALEQRWYGWSHRAMCGFAIGDVIREGDVVENMGVWVAGSVIRTLGDARDVACKYAESVS